MTAVVATSRVTSATLGSVRLEERRTRQRGETADTGRSKRPAQKREGSIPSVGTMKFVVHCKKEAHDVYIGRPGPWGNPFSHLEGKGDVKVDSREEAIACYKEWLLQHPEVVKRVKRELKGKVLGCWCFPKACHGDVLARIANELI